MVLLSGLMHQIRLFLEFRFFYDLYGAGLAGLLAFIILNASGNNLSVLFEAV